MVPQLETTGVETRVAGYRVDRPRPDPRSRRAAEHGLTRTVENDLVIPRHDPRAFQRTRLVIDHQIITRRRVAIFAEGSERHGIAADDAESDRLMLHGALHRDRQAEVETDRRRHGGRRPRNAPDPRKAARDFPDHT